MNAATIDGIGDPRAAADLAGGFILATVEIDAEPEQVFAALTSDAVASWLVRPGVWDTRTWEGDVRPGGEWATSGVSRRGPYAITGTYQVVESPHRLVQTWQMALLGASGASQLPEIDSVVEYVLSPVDAGTRLTLRHTGFSGAEQCARNCLGWETSLAALRAHFNR
ncbi:hypothetical protein JCM18899A_48520 [Nocardioides sp. AN3]